MSEDEPKEIKEEELKVLTEEEKERLKWKLVEQELDMRLAVEHGLDIWNVTRLIEAAHKSQPDWAGSDFEKDQAAILDMIIRAAEGDEVSQERLSWLLTTIWWNLNKQLLKQGSAVVGLPDEDRIRREEIPRDEMAESIRETLDGL